MRNAVTTIRLERELLDNFRDSARENDRTVAAEIRVAMRQYLGGQPPGVSHGSEKIRPAEG